MKFWEELKMLTVLRVCSLCCETRRNYKFILHM